MEWLSFAWQAMHDLVHVEALRSWLESAGPWFMAALCAVVFCETGLVFMPFLPGDSLLFAVGALAAVVPGGNLPWIFPALVASAIAGDALNYSVGAWVGSRVFTREKSFWFNPSHLKRAGDFYTRYGGKTIIMARFIPIIRTFAPFVAGAGGMNYTQFAVYNVVGAALWVGCCSGAGYMFGNIPVIRDHFELVVLGIVLVSVVPVGFEAVQAWRSRKGRQHAIGGGHLLADEKVATPPAA